MVSVMMRRKVLAVPCVAGPELPGRLAMKISTASATARLSKFQSDDNNVR